jgi:hypothetical protein
LHHNNHQINKFKMMQQQGQQQKLSLFQNLSSVTSKAITLEEVERLVRYDSHVATKTSDYRKMKDVLGKAKADEEVKEKLLPAISVAVLFDGNGRRPAHILGFTRLALVDIDHVEDVDGVLARVKADPHTLMAYKTVSGEGLRILYLYLRKDPAAHIDATTWPAAYQKGNKYFARLAGCDYDKQCGDYTRLCGLAHDADVYVNTAAEPFIITDEEVLDANFTLKQGRGKARKEDPTGSHTVSVDDAWPKMEQTLQRMGQVYQSGHHHDYVMHAAFLMNRYGVALDDFIQRAAQEWSDYDATQRERTIRSCYKRKKQYGTWRLGQLARKAKDSAIMMQPEIREWLRARLEVVYNLVTDMTMWRLKDQPEIAAGQEWQQMDERVVCSIRSQIAHDSGKRVLKSDVSDELHSDFARLFHPVREYIEALPAWAGRDRVGELCSHIKPEDTDGDQKPEETLRWALHKWLVAMVATWMSDCSTNHEIFVLIGPQGIYKTTFFRHLLPPPLRTYFWENAHNSFASKDDHLALAENCIVEIEEIDLQNPRDISELKALATSEKVKERRPYARFREERHRLASFCGSGNQERFLSDDTGNRRWLCFKVNHIDDPRAWGIDYDQLYAQLRDELAQGFRYWFDYDEQIRVERHNQAFRIESDEAQLIRANLRPPRQGEKITLMNAASICQFINGGSVGRGLSSRKVGLAMKLLGFKSVHTMAGNFYEVYQIPVNELQSALAETAGDDSAETPEKDSWEEQELPF